MAPELNDAIHQLAMHDSVVHATLRDCRFRCLSEADTLAHLVMILATSKAALEGELLKMAKLAPIVVSIDAESAETATEDAVRERLARVFDAMPASETLRGSEIAGQIRAGKESSQ